MMSCDLSRLACFGGGNSASRQYSANIRPHFMTWRTWAKRKNGIRLADGFCESISAGCCKYIQRAYWGLVGNKGTYYVGIL